MSTFMKVYRGASHRALVPLGRQVAVVAQVTGSNMLVPIKTSTSASHPRSYLLACGMDLVVTSQCMHNCPDDIADHSSVIQSAPVLFRSWLTLGIPPWNPVLLPARLKNSPLLV
jgi:hypothetical protein